MTPKVSRPKRGAVGFAGLRASPSVQSTTKARFQDKGKARTPGPLDDNHDDDDDDDINNDLENASRPLKPVRFLLVQPPSPPQAHNVVADYAPLLCPDLVRQCAIVASSSPVKPSHLPPSKQRTARIADPPTAKRVQLAVFSAPERFTPRVGSAVLLVGVKTH
ncbi:hypothetical protein GGI35DRAFT_485105 [Trichoderma velutinum]